MSRGLPLTDDEIQRAKRWREKSDLTWREIASIIGRDHTGLRRAVQRTKSTETMQKPCAAE